MDRIKIYTRKNLYKLFDNINRYKILYVSAESGYGKTTAVNNYLKYNKLKHIRFVIDGIGDEGCLFEYFYETVNKTMGINCGVKDFEYTFVNILENNMTEEIVIVIDNWSDNKSDRLKTLVKNICGVKNKNVKVIIISQSNAGIFLSSNKECFEIKHESFELSCEDIIALFEINGFYLDDNEEGKILNESDGCVSYVYLILSNYLLNGKLELNLSNDKLISQILYTRFKKEIKSLILKISVFEHFTAEQAMYISDTHNIINVLENMLYNHFFITFDIEMRTYRIHSILRNFLQNELIQENIDIEEIHRKNATYFFEKGL